MTRTRSLNSELSQMKQVTPHPFSNLYL